MSESSGDEPLKLCDAELVSLTPFVRIGHEDWLSVAHVKRVRRTRSGELRVAMQDGELVDVAAEYADELMQCVLPPVPVVSVVPADQPTADAVGEVIAKPRRKKAAAKKPAAAVDDEQIADPAAEPAS